jgi:ABC-type transporter Mla maintaining outer membrane lipid asymmetry ATPase subunit MlaF
MADKKTEPEAGICLQLIEADLGSDSKAASPLLKGVNWTIREGEFWVVSGLHLSGKSTLLSSVGMLLKPLAGQVRVFGVDPWVDDEVLLGKQRLRLGVVFETGARLLHKLSVMENVALPLCYHQDCSLDDASERVAELLKFTGVLEWAYDLPGVLSRSSRQRASLARALALSPEILLIDNPLAAVDPREKTWWLETVQALSQGHPIVGGKPMTIIVTADDPRPWMQTGRRFMLLHENNWRQFAGTEEITASEEPLLKEMFH